MAFIGPSRRHDKTWPQPGFGLVFGLFSLSLFRAAAAAEGEREQREKESLRSEPLRKNDEIAFSREMKAAVKEGQAPQV